MFQTHTEQEIMLNNFKLCHRCLCTKIELTLKSCFNNTLIISMHFQTLTKQWASCISYTLLWYFCPRDVSILTTLLPLRELVCSRAPLMILCVCIYMCVIVVWMNTKPSVFAVILWCIVVYCCLSLYFLLFLLTLQFYFNYRHSNTL